METPMSQAFFEGRSKELAIEMEVCRREIASAAQRRMDIEMLRWVKKFRSANRSFVILWRNAVAQGLVQPRRD